MLDSTRRARVRDALNRAYRYERQLSGTTDAKRAARLFAAGRSGTYPHLTWSAIMIASDRKAL
jgi:hypothetical protein